MRLVVRGSQVVIVSACSVYIDSAVTSLIKALGGNKHNLFWSVTLTRTEALLRHALAQPLRFLHEADLFEFLL